MLNTTDKIHEYLTEKLDIYTFPEGGSGVLVLSTEEWVSILNRIERTPGQELTGQDNYYYAFQDWNFLLVSDRNSGLKKGIYINVE
jgi:hypothetical protein